MDSDARSGNMECKSKSVLVVIFQTAFLNQTPGIPRLCISWLLEYPRQFLVKISRCAPCIKPKCFDVAMLILYLCRRECTSRLTGHIYLIKGRPLYSSTGTVCQFPKFIYIVINHGTDSWAWHFHLSPNDPVYCCHCGRRLILGYFALLTNNFYILLKFHSRLNLSLRKNKLWVRPILIEFLVEQTEVFWTMYR